MLGRDWKAGETLVLLVALLVAVAAMSAVGFFTDRVRQAVTQQAGEALAADLKIESDTPIDSDFQTRALAREIETAEIVNFRSVILSGDASALADVRGVTDGYPLRGEMRIADELAGTPRRAQGVPLRGEIWAEPSLLARLDATVGDERMLGVGSGVAFRNSPRRTRISLGASIPIRTVLPRICKIVTTTLSISLALPRFTAARTTSSSQSRFGTVRSTARRTAT